jgi:CzcA family heavy metal efflux pump
MTTERRLTSLPQLCLDHPIGTLALILAAATAGVIAAVRLPVSLMADIVYPMVRVQLTSGQTPPEVLLQTVTRVLEQQLAQAEGLELLESATEQGRVQATLSFTLDRDIDAALRETATLVDRAKGSLPADIDPPIIFKFDPQNLPVLEFALSSDVQDAIALRRFAEYDLVPRFIGVPGVAGLRAAGGQEREIQIRADPDRLRAHGLTLSDLDTALRSNSIQAAAGRLDTAGAELTGQVVATFRSVREIEEIRLPAPNGELIPLRDLAQVVDAHKEQRLFVTIGGQDAVKVSVFKSPQANSVAVAEAVRARLNTLRDERFIPPGVSIAVTADESIYIRQAVDNATHALFLAAALVALVVLLFLNDWRPTLVAMLVLPVAMLVTAWLMAIGGLSLNLMSLGGLILGIALLVDYGVVLLENISRHRTQADTLREAVARASREVSGALLASLLALVASLVPFLLFGGVSLIFFEEFLLTIVIATAAGLVTAFALIPALYPIILGRGGSAHAVEGRVMRGITNAYRSVLAMCLTHRYGTITAAVVALVLGVAGLVRLGYVFLPEIDDGRVTVTIQGAPGMLASDFQAQARRIEQWTLAREGVALVDLATGGRIGQTIQETPAEAEMLVQLVPKADRDISVQEWIAAFDEVVAKQDLLSVRVRAQKARIRAIRTFAGQASSGDFDVVVRIQGQDTGMLAQLGEEVAARLEKVSSLTNVDTTLVLDQPTLRFSVNRERAGAIGVSAARVSDAVATAVGGAVSAQFVDTGLYYPVRLMNDRRMLHGHLQDLLNQPVHRLPNGDVIPLSDVAVIERTKGPATLDRVNQATVNMVTGTVRGRTLGQVASDVRRALETLEMPPGYGLSFGGRMAALAEGSTGTIWIAALSLFLIIVVLAVQYESVINPMLIVAVLPLGLVGATAALWLTDTPLSATAVVGMVLLMGIAANNAIVLVVFIEQLRAAGRHIFDAVREGATARLRPKLMTALVAMVGMLPLVNQSAEGNEMLQPLAVTVLGGLPVSLLATLLVLPALYVTVHGLRASRSES